MMDGNTEAQLQCLGRPFLCCFSLANTIHFLLLVFIPLIFSYTAAVYHYPPIINTSSLENVSYVFKAQLRILFRFRVYS